jgi:hypothetical protein
MPSFEMLSRLALVRTTERNIVEDDILQEITRVVVHSTTTRTLSFHTRASAEARLVNEFSIRNPCGCFDEVKLQRRLFSEPRAEVSVTKLRNKKCMHDPSLGKWIL